MGANYRKQTASGYLSHSINNWHSSFTWSNIKWISNHHHHRRVHFQLIINAIKLYKAIKNGFSINQWGVWLGYSFIVAEKGSTLPPHTQCPILSLSNWEHVPEEWFWQRDLKNKNKPINKKTGGQRKMLFHRSPKINEFIVKHTIKTRSSTNGKRQEWNGEEFTKQDIWKQ